MTKLKTFLVVAGLISAFTTIGAHAQTHVPGSNHPNYPKPSEHLACDSPIGHLRRTSAAEIAAIHPDQRVVLMPVCESESLIVTDDYGDLFVRGNVDRLRLPIARNPTLMSALSAKDYDHYDVVGLREGASESIILYVRQRHIR